MASNGGGFNRFARRKTDAPVKAPAPAKTDDEKLATSPNNDFAAFASGGVSPAAGGMDSFAMFSSSFDMDYEADKPSYDYSDFASFQDSEKQAETEVGSPNSTTAAVAPTQSTIPSQESISTPVITNKSTGGGGGGPFQFRASSQGTNSQTSPPRPTETPAPQQQQQQAPAAASGNKSSGLSMFSSRKRASSKELATPAARQKTNNGPRLESAGVSATATPAPPNAVAVETTTANNKETFQRVLPPPSIPPSKPTTLQTNTTVPSTTPKAASTTNTGVLAGVTPTNQESFATPMPRGTTGITANKDSSSSLAQTTTTKTMDGAMSTFVTPEQATAATATNPAMSNNNIETQSFASSLDKDTAQGFDDLLSLFLENLRSSSDLLIFNDAEILDLSVELSRAFYSSLKDQSDAMELYYDRLQDSFYEHADSALAEMRSL